MASDVPLDYAVFQLSPRRSRCELFVSYDGTMESIASGLVKPFVTNLKVAEEQAALAVKSIKLEVERYKNAESWFTKGTLERFVRFVSTPEVLEMVNTYDAEMSQLESARRIYSQGTGDHQFTTSGDDGTQATAASDATKKELLKAIDVRLGAVKDDLTTACKNATAAGFNPLTVSELQHFAHHFGAHRLSEACSKFIGVSDRRRDLFLNSQCAGDPLRSSAGSDMSLDDDQSTPSTCHQDKDKPTTTTTTSSTATESGNDPTQSSAMRQLTRRLSVQERINLFESKQKENNSSSSVSSSPSVSTPSSVSASVTKPELRRLSSDVNSSSDKAVLRRWSGASDMSIDVSVSGERKDHHHQQQQQPDSNANTPTDEDSKDSKLPVRAKFGAQLGVPSGGGGSRLEEPNLSELGSKIPPFPGRSSENVGLRDKPVRSRVASFGRSEDFELEKQSDPSQTLFKSTPAKTEQSGSVEQISSLEKAKDLGSDGQRNEPENEGLSSQFRASQRRTIEVSSESETPEVNCQPLIQEKEGECDPMPPQPKWRSLGVEVEKSGRKDSEQLEKQSERSSMQMDKPGSLKSQGRKEEPFSSTPIVPVDQAQRVRQSKGNQGLNDELKMKANELEKLFAEHKLRAPGDQSNSARRTRPTEMQEESSVSWKPVMKMEHKPIVSSTNMENFNSSTPLMKNVDNHQDYDVTPKDSTYSLGFSDDSRGTLYQKYMQKRDAKLREDWSSRRVEKEAKLKAMQDTLEKSRTEIKSKLAASADKRSSAHGSRRAEKPRSFNVRSAIKREQPMDSFMSDEDKDQTEFLGKKLSETSLGDSSSRSARSKRVLPNKHAAASTPRNSAVPTPRSSTKASNSTAGRRRLNSDNPLAQSVPNFSDLRKESTKPSSGATKSSRPQGRIHARKKSSSEELPLPSEEKPKRAQSLRKSTAVPIDLNDSRNSDDIDVTHFMPSKYDIEENDIYNKFSKDMETMPFPKKGNAKFGAEEMIGVAKEQDDDDFGGKSPDRDNGKGRKSEESDKSANSGYDNDDGFQFSQVGSASITEFPTSMPSLFRTMGSIQDSPVESPGSWNSRVNNMFSFSNEISDFDASESPIGSPASWNFHALGQVDAEASRMRKKWGAAQKPIVGVDSSHAPSRKDVTKGFKRFLKFGRKNRASESLADWVSATTSEGDDDTEDGRSPSSYRPSEDLRKSRMGFSQSHHSDDGFNESGFLNEQVQALQSSIPTSPSNFKLREEHLSSSSLKAPKSFFSLSNFRSKGSDSKPR